MSPSNRGRDQIRNALKADLSKPLVKTMFTAITDATPAELERFWGHVEKRDDGCLIWTGSTSRGYGYFFFRTRPAMQVHRFIYRAMVGAIPEGFQIDHLCRVRTCVNTAHLEAVTQVDNLRRSRQTKLTPDDVRHIYRLTDQGLGRKEIAELFGVIPMTITQIALGYLWKDLYAEWDGPGKGVLRRKPA